MARTIVPKEPADELPPPPLLLLLLPLPVRVNVSLLCLRQSFQQLSLLFFSFIDLLGKSGLFFFQLGLRTQARLRRCAP